MLQMHDTSERLGIRVDTDRTQRRTAALAAKRLLDLAIAIPLCAVLAPVMAIVALAIRIESPGPVLFRQERWGQEMRPFTIYKFRSLRHAAPDPHPGYEMTEDDPRITRVGAWIRRTSLDELPQLFNVIAGSMSLVGPRPLVASESRETLRHHAERYAMPPGITGLSQITIRNGADLATRSDYDVQYARTWSLWLDVRILALTPLQLTGGAIYPESGSGGTPR